MDLRDELTIEQVILVRGARQPPRRLLVSESIALNVVLPAAFVKRNVFRPYKVCCRMPDLSRAVRCDHL